MPLQRKIILLVLAIPAVFLWSMLLQNPRTDDLSVYFFDVGQGDSVFIQTPNGTRMLVDGGPSNILLERLGAVLPYHDRFIDIVVMTHPQQDHIAGLLPVFQNYDIGMVVESGAKSESLVYNEIERMIQEKNIRRVIARAGTRIYLDDGVIFDIFSPYEDIDEGSVNTGNDIMVVGKLNYLSSSLLLTGDLEKIDELNLTMSNFNLRSDILKVAHHGSRYSSFSSFLGRVSPRFAVISVGVNTYGHPHEETLARLQNIHVAVHRTDEEGTILFRSNGLHFAIVK